MEEKLHTDQHGQPYEMSPQLKEKLCAYRYDRGSFKLCNQIAAILSYTYVELGEAAEFTDDEALLMIRDLLLDFNENIIDENRFVQLRSQDKSGYTFGDNSSHS